MSNDNSQLKVYTQHNIQSSMGQPDVVTVVEETLLSKTWKGMKEVGSYFCNLFGFKAPNGTEQISGCCKALRTLEDQGKIELPFEKATRELNPTKAEPSCPPARTPKDGVSEEITLCLVETPKECAYFNEIVDSATGSDHPDRGRLIGRQVKYLIKSGEDIVGCMGFDSPNLNSAKRSSKLNIEYPDKDVYLHYFINLRILAMRSGWRDYKNKAIELATKQISTDFENLYNYKPLLIETNVDQDDTIVDSLYSLKWELCGSGRTFSSFKDNSKKKKSKKKKNYSENYNVDIHGVNAIKEKLTFIYKLNDNLNDTLNELLNFKKIDNVSLADYLSSNDWAENECKYAQFDSRAIKTLIDIVNAKSKDPGKSFTALCMGDKQLAKRYNRFLSSKNQRITLNNIMASSHRNTTERCKSLKKVGWIVDWSDVSLKGSNCPDLGVVGTDHTVPGYRITPTFAIDEESQVQGFLNFTCESPIRRDKDEETNYVTTPIEEKNVFLWLAHLECIDAESRSNPNRTDMAIFDRGGDIAQIFLERDKRFTSTELIIRAKKNRVVSDEEQYDGESEKVIEHLRKSKYFGDIQIMIRPKSRKKNTKKKYRKKKDGEKKRISDYEKRPAVLRIHYAEVEINVPKHLISLYGRKTIKLNAVLAREYNPPSGQKRVEWLIWTTLPINSLAEAIDVVKWYSKRWTVEEFFRVMKTVFKVEKIRFREGIRIKRAIAVIAIAAWRSMCLLAFARANPNLPATLIFNDDELFVLSVFAKQRGYITPLNCGNAVLLVAMLGGYIDGKRNRRPGYQIFNAGYEKLQTFCYYNKIYMEYLNE